MIDFTKPVKTTDGKSVRILATDRAGMGYPVVGLITNCMGEELLWEWTAEGKDNACEDNPHHNDLVQVTTTTLDVTKPVQTRSGLPARIVATDFKHPNVKMQLVVIFTDKTGNEFLRARTRDGKYYSDGYTESDFDLVNAPQTTTLFEVGDIVSKYGNDLHRVVEFNDDRDLMLVECIKDSPGLIFNDIIRFGSWGVIGDQEWASYHLVT